MTIRTTHRWRQKAVLAACLAAALWIAAPLGASVVELMDLEALVSGSDSIVEGVVEGVTSRWEEDRIYTYATVRIDDPLKGDRTRTLTIRQLGGQVGSLVAIVPGMPQFEAGDQAILFLKGAGNGTYYVVGMNQGRYLINDNVAVSNLTGVDLVDAKTGAPRGTSSVRRVEVERLKAQIRELLR